MEKPISVKQIAELAAVPEAVVHRAMRRGHLPSQEPEVVGEWLRTVYERDRRQTADDRRSFMESPRAW